VTTKAKVTDVRTAEVNGNPAYKRVVTFTTMSGKQVTFTEAVAIEGALPEVGQSVQVSYRPSDPQAARIVAGWNGWDFTSLGFLALGVLTVITLLPVVIVRLVTLGGGVFFLVSAYRNYRGSRQSKK
jgi:hypothetical protein